MTWPMGVVLHPVTGNLYFVDEANHRVRMCTPQGVVSTLAGSGLSGRVDGDGATARFSTPTALVLDTAGQNLYVTCFGATGSGSIRQVHIHTTINKICDFGFTPNNKICDFGFCVIFPPILH